MDSTKYIVTPVGCLQTSPEIKRQSTKMKRERQREETKNQKGAKVIAEKKRKDWLTETYLEMINCACQGNPWSVEKYLSHVKEIETPFVCTVGNYRVSTGGIDKSACLKTLAGELISGAIAGKHQRIKSYVTPQEQHLIEAKK